MRALPAPWLSVAWLLLAPQPPRGATAAWPRHRARASGAPRHHRTLCPSVSGSRLCRWAPSPSAVTWGQAQWRDGCSVGREQALGRVGASAHSRGLRTDGRPFCLQGCRPASWRSAPGLCGPAAPTGTSPGATASPTSTPRGTTGRKCPGTPRASQAGPGVGCAGLPESRLWTMSAAVQAAPPDSLSPKPALGDPEGGELHPALPGPPGGDRAT